MHAWIINISRAYIPIISSHNLFVIFKILYLTSRHARFVKKFYLNMYSQSSLSGTITEALSARQALKSKKSKIPNKIRISLYPPKWSNRTRVFYKDISWRWQRDKKYAVPPENTRDSIARATTVAPIKFDHPHDAPLKQRINGYWPQVAACSDGDFLSKKLPELQNCKQITLGILNRCNSEKRIGTLCISTVARASQVRPPMTRLTNNERRKLKIMKN